MTSQLDWLQSCELYGMKLDLINIQILLEALGNPHKNLSVIHIAGTNGKGSTAAMITSVLMEAGYSVGLYTSPHLISPRERIQKNWQWISEGEFESEALLLREIVERINGERPFSPTYFELMTALALHYFSRGKVDIVVLEAGMGGRLDSTNIVDSKVQVITNIDLEHTRFLGSTVSEIAREKAGIIKPYSSVITGASGLALAVIEDFSHRQNASLIRLGSEIRYEIERWDLDGQFINIRTPSDFYAFTLKLLGSHQGANSALAVGAIESLRESGYAISKEAILKGLEKARWPGRFEILRKRPLVILDAAHNPAGAQVLVNTWRDYFGEKKAQLVFSALNDKDICSMAQTLSQIASGVSVIELKSQRGMRQSDLIKIWREYLPEDGIHGANVQEIFDLIQQVDGRNTVLIAGSIYLLGEILQKFQE